MKIQHIFSKHLCMAVLIILCLGNGCKKAIEVGPSTVAANSGNVFTSSSSAQSVVAGILTRMSLGAFYQGGNSVSLSMGLAADELTNFSTNPGFGSFYLNTYTPLTPPPFWTEFYNELFYCNTAIKGITESSQIAPAVKKQLLGEVKFIRGFIYFYAVNLYGTPPLTTTDDYTVNNTIGNSAPSAIYAQIIQDLTDAQNSLADNTYVDASGGTVADRVRPNKQTASAMLARVYLYMKDWKNAEAQASSVIASSNYTLVTNLNQVFLKASKETIWALQPVSTLYLNTIDATYLIVNSSYKIASQLPLNTPLINAFETGDNRFTNWVGTFTTTTAPVTTLYYANKYKVASLSSTIAVTEYPIVMRFAEQYLIRAEARAQQNNVSGAATDLNAIRLRAGLSVTTAASQTAMLTAIYHERQVELFTEWGHRWFDLKRTGNLDAVMTAVATAKGSTWSSYKQLMPIPPTDIMADPNIKQNQGYN
jgi:hypothetical protein